MSQTDNKWLRLPLVEQIAGVTRSILKRASEASLRMKRASRNPTRVNAKKKCRHKSKIPVPILKDNSEINLQGVVNSIEKMADETHETTDRRAKNGRKRKEWHKIPPEINVSTIINAKLKTKANCSRNGNLRSSDEKSRLIEKSKRNLEKNKAGSAGSKRVILKPTSSSLIELNKIISGFPSTSKQNVKKRKSKISNAYKNEHLENVSKDSLVDLKQIVSRKFREKKLSQKSDIRVVETLNKDKSNDASFINLNDLNKIESNKTMDEIPVEEKKNIVQNVTFKKIKYVPRRSKIPTRRMMSNTKCSMASLLSLYKRYYSVRKKLEAMKNIPKLCISSTKIATYIPGIIHANNDEICVKPSKETIKSGENSTNAYFKIPDIYVGRSLKIFKKKDNANASQNETDETNNNPTTYITPDDRNLINRVFFVLYILGNVAKQIPSLFKYLFPKVLKKQVDQETYMSKNELNNTKKLSSNKKKKNVMKSKYLPPWESYKIENRDNKNIKKACLNEIKLDRKLTDKPKVKNYSVQLRKPETPLSDILRETESKSSLEKKEIEFESKSMEDFYRRLKLNDITMKNMSVQVEATNSSSKPQTADEKKVEINSNLPENARSWEVNYGTPRPLVRQQLGICRLIKASLKLLLHTNDVNNNQISSGHSSDLHLPSGSRYTPIRIKRKHIDADESDGYDKLFDLPSFCKIWKHTPLLQAKSSDKKLVYSFVRNTMTKSSTSLIRPTFPEKSKPGITVNAFYNVKKGKNVVKNIKKRRKSKSNGPMNRVTEKEPSLQDIYYEAEEASFYVDNSYPCNSQSKENEEPNESYENEEPNESYHETYFEERPMADSDCSGETVYVEDIIETSDFSCIADFTDYQEITSIQDSSIISPSCIYKEIRSFKKYKSLDNLQEKSRELDELINELKQEFSHDI